MAADTPVPLSSLVRMQPRFFRSVNLQRDARSTEALSAYVLSPHALQSLRRLFDGIRLSQYAWTLTGPYGSGKSLFALFLSSLLCRQHHLHSLAVNKLSQADAMLAEMVSQLPDFRPILVVGRRASPARCIIETLLLVPDVPPKLRRECEQLLAGVVEERVLEEAAIRYIEQLHRFWNAPLLLVIDEMGKPLEYVALHPELGDLFLLQQLAEMAPQLPMLLIGILHTVLWRQDLTPERLRNMAPLFRVTQSGLQKPPRGRILRLLATTDTEIDEFREEAQHILDEAFPGEKAPAVLLVLPAECTPELPKLVRWENWLQQPNETREIGDEMLALERNDVRQKVEQAFKRFVEVSWSHGSFSPFVVPQAYRTVFQIQKPQGVDEAVALLYKDAYRFVPRFFEQYNHNSSKLRADVRQLCIKLAEDRLGEVVITFGNSPGKDCVHKYLQQEWGIVGFDYHVHPPKNGAVKHAWEFLDKEFSDKENAKPVGNVLISLMNPPFGYDYHQLALLFSAWYGYNRADIELNIGGRLANLNEIWEDKSVDRSEKFIEQLVYVKRVAIKRRDRDKEEQEIENLVQRVFSRQEFAQQEAREAVSRLQAYLQDDKHPENRREEARRAFEILSADLRRAEAYDQKAENLLRVASKETKLDRLVDAYMNPGLPTLGIVRAEQPDPKTILERFLERISERVEVSCQEAESLSKLEDVTKFTDRLRNVLALVKRTQSQELVDRVQRAIEEVNRKAEELRQEAEDKELLGELRAITRVITAETPLKTLRQYLQRLQAMAPKAQSTKELQQQTLQKIQNAIERSEEYLQQLQERFECAQGIDELERLRSEIARKWTHYEDTPECETLRGFEERCKQVVGLLGQIKNFAYPSCPEELPQVIGELERLASQSNHSAMQKAAAIKRGDIEAYVKQEEQEALDWLRGMKIQVEQAHAEELRDLLRRLDAPPSFLPESERACVQSLRQTVQKRIESDAFESVRIRLRDIRDREKLLQIKEEIERLLEKVT